MAKKSIESSFKYPPSEYKFTRLYATDKDEMETCECGQRIRNIYVIVHPESGHELHLGSECIKNFSGMKHIADDLKNREKEELNNMFNALLQRYQSLRKDAGRARQFVKCSDLQRIAQGLCSPEHTKTANFINIRKLQSWLAKWESKIEADIKKVSPEDLEAIAWQTKIETDKLRFETDKNHSDNRRHISFSRPVNPATPVTPLHTFRGLERLQHLAGTYRPKSEEPKEQPPKTADSNTRKITAEEVSAALAGTNEPKGVNPVHSFKGDERLWHLSRSFLPQFKADQKKQNKAKKRT